MEFAANHIHFMAAEDDAFGLETQPLFNRRIAAQLDGAAGSEHAMPRHINSPAERCYHLSRGPGKASSAGDGSVGGNFATRDLADCRQDSGPQSVTIQSIRRG